LPAAKARSDYDFGSSAVLTVLPGGSRALIGAQKSGVVTAVDPDRSGEIIWQKKVGRGGRLGGVQWGVATDESTVYVAVSDLKLNAVAPGFPRNCPEAPGHIRTEASARSLLGRLACPQPDRRAGAPACHAVLDRFVP
jgi:hypothetical protein